MESIPTNSSLLAAYENLDKLKTNLSSLANLALNISSYLGNASANETHSTSNDTNGDFMMGKEGMHPLYIALYVFAALLILPGLIGNGLIIASVSKLRTLRSATNYLICSLAAADVIMMFVMVAFLIYDGCRLTLPDNIQFFLFPSLDIAVASASIMSLAAVSFDRGLAVLKPLHYDRLFNRRRALYIIKGIWGYVTFIFILSVLRCKFTGKAYQYTILTIAYFVGFIIPCGIVTISYTIILCTTVRILKMSRQMERSLRMNNIEGDKPKKQGKKKLQLHEAKVAVNLMLILVPFMVGWGFYFGTFWSEHFNGDVLVRSALYEWFLLVIPWFISSINPIVYILFTKMLRQGCRKMIRRLFQRQHRPDSITCRTKPFNKILLFRKNKSNLENQSKSLLSIWSRAKRSSSAASDTIMSRLPRTSFLVNKEGGKPTESDLD